MSTEYYKNPCPLVPNCDNTCPAIGYQDVTVCVPVTIRPFADSGVVKTHCVGEPIISKECSQCHGKPNNICRFTITQKMRVEVPVVFGARSELGEATIDCGCVSTIDCPCVKIINEITSEKESLS